MRSKARERAEASEASARAGTLTRWMLLGNIKRLALLAAN
jgi:hypothetical protein